MDAALAAWTEVAQECQCAIGLVHHVRKGPISGIEAARGAKAVTDASRVGLLLSAMTEDEAQALGIAAQQAHCFLRLDNAKANMAPAFEATWFEMVERNLQRHGGLSEWRYRFDARAMDQAVGLGRAR